MRPILFLTIACSAVLASGQAARPDDAKTAEAASQAALQAFNFRRELVAEIVQDQITPAEAFTRLQSQDLPAGFDFGPEAGLAIAATDIGQTLIASGRPVDAELFFKEAEESFGAAIAKTKDADARGKAGLLEQRAFIRANFLNKTPAADEDLAAAIKLQPDDKRLQRKRESLPAAKAARKQDQPKG